MTTILVVDDSAFMSRLIGHALAEAGYRVLSAENGLEALACLREHPAALVFLDLEMPVMGGLETLAALRAKPRTADTPVVVLTSRGQEQDYLAAMAAGASAYLTKPFSSVEIVQIVEQLLRK